MPDELSNAAMPATPAATDAAAPEQASRSMPVLKRTATRSYKGTEPREFHTGDVLLLSGTGWDSWVIRLATRSAYSHAGLVYVWEGPARKEGQAESQGRAEELRVYVLEARGKQGVRLVPLSLLVHDGYYERIDHYTSQDMTEDERGKVIRFAFPQLGKLYDYSGIFRFALFLIRVWLSYGAKNPKGWRRRLADGFTARLSQRRASEEFFCSELVAAAFVSAGIPVELPAQLISPQDLVELGPRGPDGKPYLRKHPPLRTRRGRARR